jgi:transglutaminase-like putative cysteine protease
VKNARTAEGFAGVMPEPESTDLGRYLEDTITIDWQTPEVVAKAKQLLEDAETPESRATRLFEFVRDEISHSQDIETEAQTCRASEVLREGTGLCYAKSHLLAGLLRIAGFPTGFCYVRLSDAERPGRFVLHGFNSVYWSASERWIFLDARGGGREDSSDARSRTPRCTEFRTEAPWSLAYPPDLGAGESHLPYIYRRPAKRIIDLLDRAPSLAAVVRNLPDAI